MSYDAPKTTRQTVSALWRWVRAIPRRLTLKELDARAAERQSRARAIAFITAKQPTRHGRGWWARRVPHHRRGYSKVFLASFNFIRDNGRNPVYNNSGAPRGPVDRGGVEHLAWVKGWRAAVAAAA